MKRRGAPTLYNDETDIRVIYRLPKDVVDAVDEIAAELQQSRARTLRDITTPIIRNDKENIRAALRRVEKLETQFSGDWSAFDDAEDDSDDELVRKILA